MALTNTGEGSSMQNIEHEILNNEFVKLLLEAIGDGVFILNRHGKIVSWNPAMEKITGYSAAQVMGESCQVLNFNQCFGRKCPSGMSDCGILKFGKVVATECMLTHKNGRTLSVSKNVRVIRNREKEIRDSDKIKYPTHNISS